MHIGSRAKIEVAGFTRERSIRVLRPEHDEGPAWASIGHSCEKREIDPWGYPTNKTDKRARQPAKVGWDLRIREHRLGKELDIRAIWQQMYLPGSARHGLLQLR